MEKAGEEAGGAYNCLLVQDVAGGAPQQRQVLLQGHRSTVYALVASQTRPLVFSGSYDRTIKVWNAESLACVATLVGHKWAVFSLALWENSDGRARLFSGSGDHNIGVWDVASLTHEKSLVGHTYDIRALAVSNGRLYSGCYDMTIKIWNAETLELLHTIKGLVGPPFALRIHEPSKKLYSAGWNKTIDVYDLDSLERVGGLGGIDSHQSLVYCLEMLGTTLVSGSIDNSIKLWRREDGCCLKTLRGHALGVNGLAIVGSHLYTASDDKTIQAWRLTDGPEDTPDFRVDAPNGVKCLSVAVDGRLWAGIESPADV